MLSQRPSVMLYIVYDKVALTDASTTESHHDKLFCVAMYVSAAQPHHHRQIIIAI